MFGVYLKYFECLEFGLFLYFEVRSRMFVVERGCLAVFCVSFGLWYWLRLRVSWELIGFVR